ncbi:hypothetical protein RUND412_007643 [Rhizina undulata]
MSTFRAADHVDGKRHLLLACTGSVATIKLPLIVDALSIHKSLSIHILMTDAATKFISPASLSRLLTLPNVDRIWRDEDEWPVYPEDEQQREGGVAWRRGDPVLHIELRRWADLLVIAPLGANSLAKIVAGMCDNLLLSVIRAWDVTAVMDYPGVAAGVENRRKKILVFPAMNTQMYIHPLTARHLEEVEKWDWCEVHRPVEKTLACGDTGVGAMREWGDVVEVVVQRLRLENAAAGAGFFE